MAEAQYNITTSDMPLGTGVIAIDVAKQTCPHCGARVSFFADDWGFTSRKGRKYHCWSCGDDMHCTPENLTENEQAIYEKIKDDGPITAEDIADELGDISSRQVQRLLSPTGDLCRNGVRNKKPDGYYLHK